MKNFERFCYLAMCRQEANLKRKRLLYRLNKEYNAYNHPAHTHVHQQGPTYERSAYRLHCENMKMIAKTIYSPLRRALKAIATYDSNNALTSIVFDGKLYMYSQVKELAIGYQFDNIVLKDGQTPSNPYLGD